VPPDSSTITDRRISAKCYFHWLPITQRIQYKVLVIVFKAVHKQGPDYICDMITIKEPTQSTRQSLGRLLHEPRSRLVTAGDRAFSRAAPKLFNKLPRKLRDCDSDEMFKNQLKTYLFGNTYHDFL